MSYRVKHRIIKSAGFHKTKPYRCPVCNKKTLFVLLIGEEAGRLKQCKNCGYKHKDADDYSS